MATKPSTTEKAAASKGGAKKADKKAEPKVLGLTREELKNYSMSELTQIAKEVELENGTDVHFNYFHFLKKQDAIDLLFYGNNKKAAAKRIVDAKTSQMAILVPKTQAGIQKRVAAQRERKDARVANYNARLVGMVKIDKKTKKPTVDHLPEKIRKDALAAYANRKK